jgi:hypothetical protein
MSKNMERSASVRQFIDTGMTIASQRPKLESAVMKMEPWRRWYEKELGDVDR